jgi:hypothetical protein
MSAPAAGRGVKVSAFRNTGPKQTIAKVDEILDEAPGQPVPQTTILARAWDSVDYRDAGRTWIEDFQKQQQRAVKHDPDLECVEPERAFAKGYGRPAEETQDDRYAVGIRQFIVNRILGRRRKYERVTAEGAPYIDVRGEPLGPPHWRHALGFRNGSSEGLTPENLFAPKPERELELLHRNMAAWGYRGGIAVDEAGATLTGHHRRQIADALGLEYVPLVVEGLSDEEKIIFCLEDQFSGRQLERKQLVQVFGRLHDKLGWTQERIAEVCRMSQPTVSRALAEYASAYSDGSSQNTALPAQVRISRNIERAAAAIRKAFGPEWAAELAAKLSEAP